ncbi:hypothetical protein MIDIC_50040 [Alphaproteobacteria bacterium]
MSSEKNYAKYCAKLDKPSKGWFLGLKLHVVINEIGEIQGIKLTPGNGGVPVSSITRRLTGLLFGDTGYIKKKLFEELYSED